jgi:DNA invertase Pin-like site-specific DNA recombinase
VGLRVALTLLLENIVKGQRIGYIRVSSDEQNPERQLDQVQVDRQFIDKASGKDTQRPQLEALLVFAREGDTVVVRIEFIKESLSFTGEDSPMANLLLSVMGAFAEFERALIRERQREGIVLAKERGVYRGRKKALTSAQAAELRRRVTAGEPKTSLAREFRVSRETLYKYLKAAPATPESE